MYVSSYKLFAFLYVVVSFLLSLRVLRSNFLFKKEYNKHLEINYKYEFFTALFLIFLVIIPKMLRIILWGIYKDPDYFLYEKDSNLILDGGHIQYEVLSEHVYYRHFPIYTLIIVSLRLLASLKFYETYLTIYFVSLLLFVCLTLLLIKNTYLRKPKVFEAILLGF